MLASIVQGQGFEIEFISTERDIKTCDLKFDSYLTEVKTLIDDSEHVKVEKSLVKELEGTLKKREKVTDDINDALQKKSQILFLVVTFSSLGLGFGKFASDKYKSFDIKKSLNISISFAKRNIKKEFIDTLPVVIFSTLIDTIDNKYKFFTFTFTYPIKKWIINWKQIQINYQLILFRNLSKETYKKEV